MDVHCVSGRWVAQKPLPSGHCMLLLEKACLLCNEEQGYELIACFPVTCLTNKNSFKVNKAGYQVIFNPGVLVRKLRVKFSSKLCREICLSGQRLPPLPHRQLFPSTSAPSALRCPLAHHSTLLKPLVTGFP